MKWESEKLKRIIEFSIEKTVWQQIVGDMIP